MEDRLSQTQRLAVGEVQKKVLQLERNLPGVLNTQNGGKAK
jgi:hypothetical protein